MVLRVGFTFTSCLNLDMKWTRSSTMSTSSQPVFHEVNMKLTRCISRSNFVWSSWTFLNSQTISVRTRIEKGLSRSEHKVSGSVAVLSRSLHKSLQSLHGVKKPNFVYSHVDFMVLCERGFSWLNHTRNYVRYWWRATNCATRYTNQRKYMVYVISLMDSQLRIATPRVYQTHFGFLGVYLLHVL